MGSAWFQQTTGPGVLLVLGFDFVLFHWLFAQGGPDLQTPSHCASLPDTGR